MVRPVIVELDCPLIDLAHGPVVIDPGQLLRPIVPIRYWA